MSTLCIFTSFYLNQDYISENICVNRFDKIPVCKGQCYLSKELSANEKQEKKFPDLKQKEIQLFCEERNLFDSATLPFEQADILRGNNAAFSLSTFSTSIFHPPQRSWIILNRFI